MGNKMIDENIKAKIMPQVTRIVEELGDDESVIIEDFEKRFNAYVSKGISEEMAVKTAINAVKASYGKLISMGAKMYEGFFLAATESQDTNKFAKTCAQNLLDDFIEDNGGVDSNWKPKAVDAGLIDKQGNLIYTEDVWADNGNENPNLKWRIGKKIDERMQKNAWLFCREFNSGESLEFVPCYIQAPDEFSPEFGKMYKFRSVKKVNNSGNANMTFYKNISKLVESPNKIEFKEVEEYIREIPDNVKSFFESYDDEQNIGIMPESPAPKFCITDAQIGSIEETGYGKKKVTVLETADDDGELVIMDIPDEYSNGLYEGLVGILVYRPFYAKDKNNEGEKVRSGNALGIIANPDFKIDFDVEISDENPYEEDFE